MRTKFGSHLEKSLSARFPLIVDKNRRYVSRLTTRKKAARQAACCELGFLIRADWEKLEGSHLDSHIADICPRRRVFREIALVDRFRFITHQMSQPHREQTSRDEADPEARPPRGRINSAACPQSPPPTSCGKRKAGARPAFSLRPRTGSRTLTANSRRRRGVRRRCTTARSTYRWSR